MSLYRVVQECLNNVLKHSGAKHARLRLERDVREVQFHLEDDGAGFNAAEPENSRKGLGLRNMAERVRSLGGQIKIHSQPGQGTHIEVTIPIAHDV